MLISPLLSQLAEGPVLALLTRGTNHLVPLLDTARVVRLHSGLRHHFASNAPRSVTVLSLLAAETHNGTRSRRTFAHGGLVTASAGPADPDADPPLARDELVLSVDFLDTAFLPGLHAGDEPLDVLARVVDGFRTRTDLRDVFLVVVHRRTFPERRCVLVIGQCGALLRFLPLGLNPRRLTLRFLSGGCLLPGGRRVEPGGSRIIRLQAGFLSVDERSHPVGVGDPGPVCISFDLAVLLFGRAGASDDSCGVQDDQKSCPDDQQNDEDDQTDFAGVVILLWLRSCGCRNAIRASRIGPEFGLATS